MEGHNITVLVAQYAEVLRQSYWVRDNGPSLAEIARDTQRIVEYLPRDADAQEFAQLATAAIELKATQ